MKLILALVFAFLTAGIMQGAPRIFESGEARANLVELYSSEGCSSCPPAEEWMSNLKSSPALWKAVVPVVFHVDYWDNLGWPDSFASGEFTRRQRRYEAAWHGDSVYTPEFVLNGAEWRDWHGATLPEAGPHTGKLRVVFLDAGHVKVSFVLEAAADTAKPLQVEIALLGGNIESDVKRGENGGRKLRHDFVVLQLEQASLTANENEYTATVALPQIKYTAQPVALAAWITAGDSAPVIQATGGWLAAITSR